MGILLLPILGGLLAVPLLVLLGLRLYLSRGTPCPCSNRLDGKTVIVTGASSGIGKAIATECASRGGKVVLACRNKTKSEAVMTYIRKKTGNESVFFVQLDLANLASVRDCVDYFHTHHKELDILINNAGYMGPLVQTKDGIEQTFQVNYLGHFLLTNLLLQSVRPNTSRPLRVINLSSDSIKNVTLDLEDLVFKNTPYDIYTAYGRSKLALTVFTSELNYRYAHAGVRAVAVHPGAVKTGLLRNWPGYTGSVLRAAAGLLFRAPSVGAASVIYCATVERESLEELAGKVVTDCKLMQLDSQRRSSRDFRQAERLWEISLSLAEMDKLSTQNKLENES